MKKNISFCMVFLSVAAVLAFTSADDHPFPKISGKTLAGKEISLPENSHGKFCLVAIASTMKAVDDLTGWIDPVYKTLVGNIMFRADMYFIPMTGGLKGVSQDVVERKLKQSMDTSLYRFVLLYTGPVEDYVKDLKMTEKDKPYFFVIDPRGKITFTTSGKYTEEKLDAITDALSE